MIAPEIGEIIGMKTVECWYGREEAVRSSTKQKDVADDEVGVESRRPRGVPGRVVVVPISTGFGANVFSEAQMIAWF